MNDQSSKMPDRWPGVIPAEPGWRLAITNGKTVYLVPVVGWEWFAQLFEDDGDGPAYQGPRGGPLLAGIEGEWVGCTRNLLSVMGGEWTSEGLVAPGKEYGADGADGWETLRKPAQETST